MTTDPLSTRCTRLLRSALVVLGAATSFAACNAQALDGGSRNVVFIRAALAPPAPRSDGTCVYTSDASAPVLFTGVADFGVRDDYSLTLLVQSNETGLTTTVSGAHVAVREADGTLIREFEQTTAGFVDSTGFGLVSVVAVDPPTRELLVVPLATRSISKTVVIEVVLSGTNPSTGAAASSPLYKFPLKTCNGCLVSFESGEDPTARVQPNCLRPSLLGAQGPCVPGQDEVVLCQTCVGSRAACDPLTP